MRKNIIYTILITLYTSTIFGQNIARVENVKFQSKSLNQEREILIYTPADYDWRTNEYFNVIYVFDSQNREFFDYTSSIISFLTDNTKSFIVVGITSPYNEKLDYGRSNDFLPELKSKKSIVKYGIGNADNFLDYIALEVIPYINSNYRTLNHNFAVGHSLGASFILYSLLKEPYLFANYIAISPNLAYDNDKLSKELMNFDYAKVKNSTFIYLSSANEGIEYWQEWKPARDKVYTFFKDSLIDKNITVEISEFPNQNHWSTFPPSLNNAFEFYFKNILNKQDNELSNEEYKVTINVKVPKKEDVIYITGNQNNLGDWNPKKIKMKKTSDYERKITLKLKSPAQFKFTRGDWDSEAEVDGTYGNITIKTENQSDFEFEIKNYYDNY